jgi:hypothetical protein
VPVDDELLQRAMASLGVTDVRELRTGGQMTKFRGSRHAAGIDFALADLRQPVIETARRTGLLETLGEDRIIHTVDEAVQNLSTYQPDRR